MPDANKPCSALASALHEADPAAIDALLAFIRSAITDSVAEQLNTLWNLEKYDPDSDDPVDRVPWLFENDAMSASDFSLTEVMGSLPAASKSTPPSTASYGWLAPNGTFYDAPFSCHQSWAEQYVAEHPDIFFPAKEGCDAADLLSEHGWVLIHNPDMTVPRVTVPMSGRVTKAQRNFLYDYFAALGRWDDANEAISGLV